MTIILNARLTTLMPNEGAMPLVTRELSKKSAEYKPDTEEVSRSGMPKHREFVGAYHALELPDKQKLAQTAIDKALKQAEITNVLDAEDYPEITKNFRDTPETDKPQVFVKSEAGNRQHTVYIRLNNGENDNTVIIFNTKSIKGGEFATSLKETEGLFHITTQKNLDKARRSPFSRVHWSKEGAWMRGGKGGTAEKYRDKFEKKKKTTLSSFWKEKDEKRTAGIESKKRTTKRQQAERALEMWEKKDLQEELIKIWSKEDETREKWRERVAKARRMDEEFRDKVYDQLDKLGEFGVRVLGQPLKRLGEKALEVGKEKVVEAVENVDVAELWETLKENVTIRIKKRKTVAVAKATKKTT